MTGEFLASMYKTSGNVFKKAVDGIPKDEWFKRPGDESNHLMFIAGHLVTSRALVLKTLQVEWSAPWLALFSRGAKMVETEKYPDCEEILKAWDEVSEKLALSLSSVTPEFLAQPAPPRAPGYDGKIGGTIGFLAFHETYHVGQVGYLRKWLGHGQAVG